MYCIHTNQASNRSSKQSIKEIQIACKLGSKSRNLASHQISYAIPVARDAIPVARDAIPVARDAIPVARDDLSDDLSGTVHHHSFHT